MTKPRPDYDELDVEEQRYMDLVVQLRDEAGGEVHGWKTAVGKRLGIKQPHVTQLMDGSKPPGETIRKRAMRLLGLRPEYFLAPEPVDYRDFQGPADSTVEREEEVTAAWRSLEDDGTIDGYRTLGMPEDVVRWVRDLPGGRGGLTRNDYIEELDRQLRKALWRRHRAGGGLGPEPDEMKEARESIARRGGPGGRLPKPDDK